MMLNEWKYIPHSHSHDISVLSFEIDGNACVSSHQEATILTECRTESSKSIVSGLSSTSEIALKAHCNWSRSFMLKAELNWTATEEAIRDRELNETLYN